MAFSSRTDPSGAPPLRDRDLDALSDRELESLLFENGTSKQQRPRGTSFFTWKKAGLAAAALVLVGVAAGALFDDGMLGELAVLGVLVFFFTKRPFGCSRGSSSPAMSQDASGGLTRSRSDKKLMGVCGGIAAYFDVDSTLVRVGFVAGLLLTGGPPMGLAYLLLAWTLPNASGAAPSSATEEERLRVIRES